MAELVGEDLELELLSPFLEARPVIPDNPEQAQCWMYRETPMSAKQLTSARKPAPSIKAWRGLSMTRNWFA